MDSIHPVATDGTTTSTRMAGEAVREAWAQPADKGDTFRAIASKVGETCAAKNAAYGDSFARSGEVLRIMFPEGIRPDQFDDALGVVRVVDKLFRIATDRDALGEDPWIDVAGYGVLGAARRAR